MHRRRSLKRGAVVAAVLIVAAACAEEEEPRRETAQVRRGGVWRVGWHETFNFTAGFDPSAEYLGDAHGIYSNLLVRTLIGYRHVAGVEGNEVVPDLAEDMPEVSDDGRTYTFKIRDGVRFGPPVSREITSNDFVYAFERLATDSVAPGYAFYYTDLIRGMKDFEDGRARTIVGLETPDDDTLIIRLTQPVGDFLFRMSMPATGPIPREVGECHEGSGEYGRYLISSGPYMIEGSDQLDTSNCSAHKPISGFDPTKFLRLVRNPNYDQATDDQRENYVDRFEFVVNTNVDDIYNKIEAGELESAVPLRPPPQFLRRYIEDPDLTTRLHTNSGDRTWYINFVLTEPPFDDIHVRKAVNLVMDKEGLRRTWGGAIAGDVATHITPPIVTGGAPGQEYDPYPSANFSGNLNAAKEEMRKSKYDTNKDGSCDASVCRDISHLTRNVFPWPDMVPTIEASMEKLGMTLRTRELAEYYVPWQTVDKTSPIASGSGWGKDYADALTFVSTLFHSESIAATNNTNVWLTGLTADQARELGVKIPPGGVPSVDADIEECRTKSGNARRQCWVDLDKKIMEEIAPWVPYLWASNNDLVSAAVTKYEYDQFPTTPAYSRLAVDETKQ